MIRDLKYAHSNNSKIINKIIADDYLHVSCIPGIWNYKYVMNTSILISGNITGWFAFDEYIL